MNLENKNIKYIIENKNIINEWEFIETAKPSDDSHENPNKNLNKSICNNIF